MAIAFKSTEQDNRGATSTPTIDKPVDLADGDYLYVELSHDTTSTVTTPPTGFTHIATKNPTGANAALHVFGRYVADAAAANAEGTWTITMSDSNSGSRVCRTTYTGVDPSTPLDVAAVTNESLATATPSIAITPVTSGAWVVAAFATKPASGVYTGTPTASWTERHDSGVSSTSYSYVEDILWTSGAFTSQPTFSASDDWVGIAVALRPAGSAGIAFTPSPNATLQFTPILGIPVSMSFAGTFGVAFEVASGTPYAGGPGAGVGGISKGKAVLLLGRRRGRR